MEATHSTRRESLPSPRHTEVRRALLACALSTYATMGAIRDDLSAFLASVLSGSCPTQLARSRVLVMGKPNEEDLPL